MAALPMAHVLEFEEIVPVRPYEAFADDVRSKWPPPWADAGRLTAG
jgi:hypothetical protein